MLFPRLAVALAGCLCCACTLNAQSLPSLTSLQLSAPIDSGRVSQGYSLKRTAPPFFRASAAAVGVSAVVSMADGPLMQEIAKLRAPAGGLRQASVFCAALGGIVPLSLGATLWAGGALTKNDFAERIGFESTQAVMLSGVITIGVKGIIGRSRPNSSDDADDFSPGRGFFNAQRASFPSGHTSAAFSVATVLSSELSARYPSRRWLIRGALYGAATTVGLARMYQNVHWPSDVVTGAALGTLSGLQALSWHGRKQ